MNSRPKKFAYSSAEVDVSPASVFSQANMKFQDNDPVVVSVTLNELRLLTDLLYTIERYEPIHPDLIAIREHFKNISENHS